MSSSMSSMLDPRCEDAGEVVHHHKDDERIQEAVKASKEPAQERAQRRKHQFNLVDHILHTVTLPFLPAWA